MMSQLIEDLRIIENLRSIFERDFKNPQYDNDEMVKNVEGYRQMGLARYLRSGREIDKFLNDFYGYIVPIISETSTPEQAAAFTEKSFEEFTTYLWNTKRNNILAKTFTILLKLIFGTFKLNLYKRGPTRFQTNYNNSFKLMREKFSFENSDKLQFDILKKVKPLRRLSDEFRISNWI